jgi:hypothetical protein
LARVEWVGAVLLIVIVLAASLWPLTIGRRYFGGEKENWPQIRRDLYTGSYDEGIYPLDPPREDRKSPDST